MESLENQTAFASAQPVLDKSPMANGQLPIKRTNTKLIFGGVAVFFVIMLVLIALSAKRSTGPNTTTAPSPTPDAQQSATASSQLEKTLETLHKDIQQADPSINELPFPPINGELFIQEQRL